MFNKFMNWLNPPQEREANRRFIQELAFGLVLFAVITLLACTVIPQIF